MEPIKLTIEITKFLEEQNIRFHRRFRVSGLVDAEMDFAGLKIVSIQLFGIHPTDANLIIQMHRNGAIPPFSKIFLWDYVSKFVTRQDHLEFCPTDEPNFTINKTQGDEICALSIITNNPNLTIDGFRCVIHVLLIPSV